MDPFVEVSTGKEVLRTRVVRHSRNPVWDEQLLFHVGEHELSLPLRLTVFDRDRIASNDYVGEAEINIATLVERAAKKDLNTGYMHEFELPLIPAKKPGRVYNLTPTIT